MRVVWISRCPVKSLAIGQLDECELTEAGIAGDREFFLVDENDRLVNSKGLGVLQQVVSAYDDEAQSLRLEFPDGTKVDEQISLDGSIDARFWGNSVAVRFVSGPGARRSRGSPSATYGSSGHPDRLRTDCKAARQPSSGPPPCARWPESSAWTTSTGGASA